MSEPTTLDYDSWQRYLDICKDDGTSPSIRDYIVWRDEQNEPTE